MTLLKMIRVCLSQYSVVWLWALVVTLLGVSLASLFLSSSSNAQTIISETTEVENLGSGLELHTTTTVEEVVTEGDQETTGNYLTNQGFQKGNTNGWDTSGSVNVCATCGPFGGKALQTGPETAGGTVSQTVDLFDKMNKQEINEGFTINYGSHVFSHQSNATVPVCGLNPANGPDCRDRFSITLDIKDSSGTLLHKFEHEFEEITWTGWNTTDFFFNSTVPENTHTSALATLELFGIDAGFTTGHFGPAFDNATITATHTNMIVEQITTITEELIQTAVDTIDNTPTIETTEVTEIEIQQPEVTESFEITISDNFGDTIESFEVSIDNTEMTIEPIQTDTSIAETTVETTVEEVQNEVETQVAEVTESEVENDISNNVEPESSESSDETAAEEPESKENTQSSKAKSDEKPKSKEQVKKEIATRVVTKIIQKLGQDAASQATQLALMNVIGANLSVNAPVLQDRNDFFTTTTLPDSTISTNNYAQYIMFGGSNAAMDSLVDLQWRQ